MRTSTNVCTFLRSSAMLPVTMFFSPQHLDLGKEEERDGPTPICNQSINRLSWTNGSPCLAASDVIHFFFSFIFVFHFLYSVTSVPVPLQTPSPVERLYALSMTVMDGGSVFFSMWPFALLSAFPAASCFSAAFPLPARCFCFSFRAERGLVTRLNHRLRRRTFYRSYMLMRLLIPARFLARFNDWFYYLFRDLCLAPRGN